MDTVVPIPKDIQPIIEKFVNSKEACDLADLTPFRWDAMMNILKPLLPRPLTELEEQNLHDDLRDWWKNGNWVQDEQYPWSMGEWPWWTTEEA
jgi:hypothetical protein